LLKSAALMEEECSIYSTRKTINKQKAVKIVIMVILYLLIRK